MKQPSNLCDSIAQVSEVHNLNLKCDNICYNTFSVHDSWAIYNAVFFVLMQNLDSVELVCDYLIKHINGMNKLSSN